MDFSFSEKLNRPRKPSPFVEKAITIIRPLDRKLSLANPVVRPTLDYSKIRLNNLRLDFASCRFPLIFLAKVTYKIFIFSRALYAPTITVSLI
jgi:hypothetical protein